MKKDPFTYKGINVVHSSFLEAPDIVKIKRWKRKGRLNKIRKRIIHKPNRAYFIYMETSPVGKCFMVNTAMLTLLKDKYEYEGSTTCPISKI